jgi:hypothetical protein
MSLRRSYSCIDSLKYWTREEPIGTLNQGYPLLQHEDAAPMRRPQATRRTVPGPAAWAGQRAPRGKKRQHIQLRIMGSGPPQKGTGPLYV